MKIQKLVTIDTDLNDRLKIESNASGLINHLLREHYKPSEAKLNDKAKELNLKLEEVESAKNEVLSVEEQKEALKELTITDENLISQLRNARESPNVATVRHMKESYNIKEATMIWKAWRIIHNQEKE